MAYQIQSGAIRRAPTYGHHKLDKEQASALGWTCVAYAIVACVSQQTCGACMKVKSCAWCKSENEAFQSVVRCNSKKVLIHQGCRKDDIVDYQNSASVEKSQELSDAGALAGHAIQIKPQKMKISLRPNHPQKFKLTYRQAEDYPVDLYYLMDLTANMRHHKEKLAKLGDQLELTCRSPYGYQNHLSLNSNVTKFVQEVDSAEFSGNLDDAEGGLDAIMQAIVCQKYLNWNARSRKIILYATGSTFHVAGDGKLGGIVKPNDAHCHMDKSGYYTETINQDYPSLSQINTAIGKYNVSIIFAVPNEQINVYRLMSKALQGSTIAELAKDSSNIVHLVANQYNKISSEVRLIDNAPPGVKIKYMSKCLGSKMTETNMCTGMKVGTTIEFDIEMELKSCENNTEGSIKQMSIHPFGFQDNLDIDLEFQCDCGCEKQVKKVENSTCNGQGIKVCGNCQCLENVYGRNCECSGGKGDIKLNVENCKMTNSSRICSSRGTCQCGVCECFNSELQGQVISGEFCECDNLACLSDNEGKICGGSERGSCGCNGICTCTNGWTGSTCGCGGSDKCIAPKDLKKEICNGHGVCECGSCVCDYSEEGLSYTGEFCKDLVQKCELYIECVRCQVHNEGSLTQESCSNCSFVPVVLETISAVEDNEAKCQIEDDNDCVFIFMYRYDFKLHNVHVRAQKTKICRGQVDMVHVVIGVTGGVFFIGLTIVLIIRFCMYLRDKREYQAHLKQVADTDWGQATENPLHVPPRTEYKNPTFESKA
ncbi:Integrin beta pat-3 [Nymphon striatum]|nr:Integrin beta pat-3 [Nymphon striatum]